MALVKCRECGKEVSTEAGACPQCGAPRPTTSSSPGPLPESPFKTGPQKPLAPKPASSHEARLKELREKRRREAQRRTVARIVWGGVALALVGIGYWALREAGSTNGSPWLFAPTELARGRQERFTLEVTTDWLGPESWKTYDDPHPSLQDCEATAKGVLAAKEREARAAGMVVERTPMSLFWKDGQKEPMYLKFICKRAA